MSAMLHDTPAVFPAIGEVSIVDELVPVDLQREILRLVRRPIWAYGWKSVRTRDRYGFWHAHFAGGDEQANSSCADQLAANAQAAPVHRLWSLLSAGLLAGHEPLRVYANAHTYGVEGYVHTDTDDEAGFTTIYYAHGVWDADWAGETVFLSRETGDIAKAVSPKPGRLIVFRGATPHAARSASRECPELRVSVVFKTRLAGRAAAP